MNDEKKNMCDELGIPLHGENYHPTRDKDGRRTSCQEFLELVESLPDENC